MRPFSVSDASGHAAGGRPSPHTAHAVAIGAPQSGGHIETLLEQRTIRVLVLEDDPGIQEALAMILSANEGFVTEIVSDVASCLDRLRNNERNDASETFDVLLLDIVLRGGHLGSEVLRAATVPGVHLRLPPVIACTGLSANELIKRAPEVAASNARVLPKPFDVDELLRVLRATALSGWADRS